MSRSFVTFCVRELPLKKGDIISVIRRVDPNWLEAKLKGKVGLVPSSYIEVLRVLSLLLDNIIGQTCCDWERHFECSVESQLENEFTNIWLPPTAVCRIRSHVVTSAKIMFLPLSVCLSEDNSKNCPRILMKFFGGMEHMTYNSWSDFGDDLGHEACTGIFKLNFYHCGIGKLSRSGPRNFSAEFLTVVGYRCNCKNSAPNSVNNDYNAQELWAALADVCFWYLLTLFASSIYWFIETEGAVIKLKHASDIIRLNDP